jgi:hypothetical protein
MPRTLRLLSALLVTSACGERPLIESHPPDTEHPFLFLADMYFTPCATAFGAVARGQLFNVAVGKQDDARTHILNVEARLVVTARDGTVVPVEQLSKGRFQTRFASPGAYVLTAMLEDGTSLTQNVDVVEQAGLRLSPLFRKLTTYDPNGECTETANTSLPAPEGPVTLSPNQELTTAVVPVDTEGTLLLGHVDVEFSGTVDVSKSTTWGGSNTYNFRPTQTGLNLVRVTDTTLNQVSELSFEVSATQATCAAH